MSVRAATDDYRALFLTPTPMIDLRAPAEFARGAFPSAANLPLLSDDERAQVGIRYKQQGQAAAIALGNQLVSGNRKALRLQRWLEFLQQHPGAYLYCWRGGLRSQTVQEWLEAEGVICPRVIGGYKSLRQFLLAELETSIAEAQLVLISGKTGTGKTRVIERLQRSVDLEGIANHRGSSFGRMPTPQPSQIDFENSISIDLLRLLDASTGSVYVEDEGRLVGRLALPESLRRKMAGAPLLIVEEPLGRRIDVVIADYIVDLGQRYALLYGEEGAGLHAQKMQDDLLRIRKRLGGERQQRVSAMMAAAFKRQRQSGDIHAHREWIGCLLAEYYDPMYEYQLQQRDGNIVFAGDRAAVLAFARGHSDSVATR